MSKHSDEHEHKHEHKETAEKAESSESKDDNISLDFSKIKASFSGWFSPKKVNLALLTIILVLIPVILTIYIRLQPQYLPITDDWAQNSVNNYFRNQIADAINAQYPNLPTQNKNTLIDQQFAEFQKSNQQMIQNQVKATSAFFKTGFQYQENNHAYTFLGDLDSYFFLRQARNIIEKGMICDEIVAGKCIDNHMYAPVGTIAVASMHPYGIFYLYKVIHIINPAINLMQSSFLLPTVIAVIAAIAAFFVGKKIMNTAAGFFAAMFLALSPMFLSRTLGSDTDIWNVLFPLIILWLFLEAFETKGLIKKIILTALASLFMGIFSFAWDAGWWYIFDFILVAIVGYIGFTIAKNYVKHRSLKKTFSKEIASTFLVLAILIVLTALFVSAFTSFNVFKVAFTDPVVRTASFKVAASSDLWPNIITTVAEMNEASISAIVSQVSFGKVILFAVALMGIIFTLINRKPSVKEYVLLGISALIFIFLTSSTAFQMGIYTYLGILMLPVIGAVALLLISKDSEVDIKTAVILVVWFVGMIFASTKGVRFILLLIPAFAVSLGVAIGYVYQYFSRVIHKEFKIPDTVTKIGVFILLCLLLIMPFKAGLATGDSFIPNMTKGWWDSLLLIKEKSSPDAIINSWWDFGHWFKYVADRRVTLDGASQNHPNAHWLGRILQTNNEDEAVAILRMLDCGSNKAFYAIDEKYKDTLISQKIVKNIIMMSKEDAGKTLEGLGFSPEKTTEILGYTHCSPPEDYFITSGDMVGKSGVWSHFGLWDFEKAFIINNVRPKDPEEGIEILKQRLNYTDEQASSVYYDVQALQSDREMNDWISPWPNYFGGSWYDCQLVNATTKTDANTNTTNATSDTDKVKHLMVCKINVVIGEGNQGRTILENVFFDMDNHSNSVMVAGGYDTATGFRRGEGRVVPSSFILLNNATYEKVKMENVSFPFDVLIDTLNNKALISDSQLSESIFTRLFYLDGRYTEHFEKFSDTVDITGSRIIVWKVKW